MMNENENIQSELNYKINSYYEIKLKKTYILHSHTLK